MGRRIGVALLGLVVAVPMLVMGTAGTASANHRAHCVSNFEWQETYVGETRRDVHHRYGTKGWVVKETLDGDQIRKYDHCGSRYSVVRIRFEWDGLYWRVLDAERVLVP